MTTFVQSQIPLSLVRRSQIWVVRLELFSHISAAPETIQPSRVRNSKNEIRNQPPSSHYAISFHGFPEYLSFCNWVENEEGVS